MDASTKLMLSEAEKRNWDVVLKLIDNGVDVNAKEPKNKFTALNIAVLSQDLKIINELLDRGADIETLDFEDSSPLMECAYYSKAKSMRALLERGANVNFTTASQSRPIHFAFLERCQETLDVLTEFGAKPISEPHQLFLLMQEYIGDNDYTWFHNICQQDIDGFKHSFLNGMIVQPAAASPNPKFLQKLIELDWPLDCRDGGGDTLLHVAAQVGQLENVKALVEHGFSLTCKNETGETPIHLAIRGGFWYIVQYAIQQGIDVMALDKQTNPRRFTSFLHCAAEGGNDDIVRYLIDNGSDVNAYNSKGETPLMLAASRRHTSAVKTLIEHGADVNARAKSSTKTGRNIRHVDMGGGFGATVCLSGLEALEKSTDNTGSTALYYCMDRYNDVKREEENRRKKHKEYVASMGEDLAKKLEHTNAARKAASDMVHATIPDNPDERSALETAQVLIDAGAKLNMRNCRNETPLFPAVRHNWSKLVELLLKSGAEYQIENNQHEKLYKLVRENKDKQIVKLFKDLPQVNKIVPPSEEDKYVPASDEDVKEQKTSRPTMDSLSKMMPSLGDIELNRDDLKKIVSKWACSVLGLDPALANDPEECYRTVLQMEKDRQEKKKQQGNE